MTASVFTMVLLLQTTPQGRSDRCINESGTWSREGRIETVDRGSRIIDRASGYEFLDTLEIDIKVVDPPPPLKPKPGCAAQCGGEGCSGEGCRCDGPRHTACSCSGSPCACAGIVRRICPKGTSASCCGGTTHTATGCKCSNDCGCPTTKADPCTRDAAKVAAECIYCKGKTNACACKHEDCTCGSGSPTVCDREGRKTDTCLPSTQECQCAGRDTKDASKNACTCPPRRSCGPTELQSFYAPCGGVKYTACPCKSQDSKCQCKETWTCLRDVGNVRCPHNGSIERTCGCKSDKCNETRCPKKQVCLGRGYSCESMDIGKCVLPKQPVCKSVKVLDTDTEFLWDAAWDLYDAKDFFDPLEFAGGKLFDDLILDPLLKDPLKDMFREAGGRWHCDGWADTEFACESSKDACCGCSCDGHTQEGFNNAWGKATCRCDAFNDNPKNCDCGTRVLKAKCKCGRK